MTLASLGCVTNFATVLYILKRFDVRVHVFNIAYLTLWLPLFYGDVLTFMVATVRYALTVKAAKNIQVDEKT